MQKRVKLGLVQINCSGSDNLDRAILRIKKIAARGAQIICLPELFRGPYFCQRADGRIFKFAESVPGSTTQTLSKVARETKTVIIASIYEKTGAAKIKMPNPRGYFNTAVVIDADGKLLGKYRKMHIPDDMENHYGEAHYFEKGNLGFKVFKTRYAKIAPLICFDQWFPEAARACAVKGAEIIFYPTAIGFQTAAPDSETKRQIAFAEYEAWQTIQRSHAIANNIFVCAVNRVGREERLKFWGTSFVADPYGRVIARAPANREADLIVECDLKLISQMRRDWPFLNARRVTF